MISEWYEMIKARKWMKKNIPFLYAWHAYVGHELDLFEAFKKSQTISYVANKQDISKDLLQSWIEVGVAINHLKERKSGRYKVNRRLLLPKRNSLSGTLLKEMMELHIPSLLSYPELLKTKSKIEFDDKKHGEVVARTSRLIEAIAYPNYKNLINNGNVKSIIDVGCGHGGYLQRIAQEYPHIKMVGIDKHPHVVESAEKVCESLENVNIIHADVNEWNPPSKENDLVMMNNIMHYVAPDKRFDLVAKMSKWLHKTGKIIIITPVRNSEHGKEFSAVFNSFFSAHSNLHTLPTKTDLETIANKLGMRMRQFDPIIKEGSWYVAVIENKCNKVQVRRS